MNQKEKILSISPDEISHERRVGNTTRQINYTIEMLFRGYIVRVLDHSNIRAANKDLLNRILRRLEIEHKLTPRPDESQIQIVKVDFDKLEIELDL